MWMDAGVRSPLGRCRRNRAEIVAASPLVRLLTAWPMAVPELVHLPWADEGRVRLVRWRPGAPGGDRALVPRPTMGSPMRRQHCVADVPAYRSMQTG